ncbi:heptaprenyl diphosphate synthase component 1 [Fictibacillus phosphorivorans]|uniref:heptaprenyl diphosphate synthase component 1 n=1 Tax=Fictibacillus phosphorivorans TaxID=1221500 RepID=UPI0020426527|nr:heptaprenyl diphosphate synthase component 1 [Fictibacillus phosphorivorans]MCM3718938.1 heptaprenyl diphosphate synthase component 1 [Fictibacillus phosphorivorans]MCM3776560.1 heptaprenyl diphosphate synthase component 1 [Fictibacillus phosphorivorans]
MNNMEKIQRLKEHTRLLMQHRYVDKFLTPPIFDEAKVFIAYCLLSELELDPAVEAEYFSSILMIQSALDRHENILDEDIASHKKRRQLVVLSGDYFSSLYYLLLSRCENLDLIAKLSLAVQQINEHKSSMHHQIHKSSKEYIKKVVQIESLLYIKAAESFGLEKYIPFIERYLLISRYQSKEQRMLLNEEQLELLHSYETDLREKKIEVPLVFQREDCSINKCIENDLMLGEG